ncbi:MAG: hypothetical protein DRI34_03330 [Deltaproteobacteria bacterium]|nr:MAG: hypothetical protein DRI34_03330 [Deltaproteobacteria bacterium]
MTTTRHPLLLAVLLLATVPVRAGGFLIYEHGAVSTGMANARSALANDPSCLYFNPAAITELPGIQIEAGTTLILPSIEYQPAGTPEQPRSYTTYRDGHYLQVPVNDGENPAAAKQKLFTPIHLYASWRLEELGLALGFGLNNPFGLGTYWPGDWDGRFIATETEIQTFYSQPVLAIDLAHWLGLGQVLRLSLAAGYDFVYGTARLGRKIDLRVAEALSLGELQSPEGELRLTGSATGHGWNLALYAELPGLLALGASLRSGVSLPFSGTASFTMDATARAAADLLGMTVPEKTTGRVTIDMPMTINAGVALLLVPRLRLAADILAAFFSSYDELTISFDCAVEGSCTESLNPEPIEKNWHTSFQFALGAEYDLLEQLTLRAGWGVVTSPVPAETYDPSLPDGLRNLISLGAGYRGSFWGVDLGYLVAFWSDSKANDVGSGDSLNPEGRANGSYRTISHQLALSLRAWF